MNPHAESHHTLFYALGAFALLLLLGSEADVRGKNAASVASSLSPQKSVAVLPLQYEIGENLWDVHGSVNAVSALSEPVCDGNLTYIAPRYYNTDHIAFGVSLAAVPDGAQITSLAVTPCLSAVGGTAPSDVAITYAFPGEQFVFRDVAGKSNPYLFGSGGGGVPTSLKTSVFSIPSLVKKPGSTLAVGMLPVRNGGGIRVSNLVVSVEYVPPAPQGSEVAEAKPFMAKLESSMDTKGFLFTDAVLTWDVATGNKGGEIEYARIREDGSLIGTWSIAGIVSEGEGMLRFPIVVGGSVRDDYTPGTRYVFRIREKNASNIPVYSERVEVLPNSQLSIATPTAFTAKINSNGKRIELSWTDNVPYDDSHMFLIERASLANTLEWKEIGRTDPYQTSWIDYEKLTPGNYFYRIRAVRPIVEEDDAFVVSGYSEIQAILLSDQW